MIAAPMISYQTALDYVRSQYKNIKEFSEQKLREMATNRMNFENSKVCCGNCKFLKVCKYRTEIQIDKGGNIAAKLPMESFHGCKDYKSQYL